MREIKFRFFNKKLLKMYLPSDCDGSGRVGYDIDYGSFLIPVDNIDEERWDIKFDDSDVMPMQYTGLKDKNGKEVYDGDIVSLAGNITADNSFGLLPNGWTFDEDDKYAVTWDNRLAAWALGMGEYPDNAYNAKYLNHARSLLINGDIEVIGNIYENPDLLNKELK